MVIFKLLSTENNGPTFMNCPTDINQVVGQDAAEATVTWTEPTAEDEDGVKSLGSNYVPGSRFPIGTTRVIYTAVDNNDQRTTCSFNIIVAGKNLFCVFAFLMAF